MPPEDGPPSFTFEWDERRDAVNSASSNTHSTNDSARGGYFGIASTKAFLRIIGVREDEYHHPVHRQTPLTSSCEKQLSLLGEHIDAYFAWCHPLYPIIHEATFRAQMMELVARPSETIWKMLLYTVAALGAFAVSTESERNDITLFDVAKAQFSHEIMEMGNMSLVQALLLMSIYLRKRYNLNSSYNYLGFANRAAMGIGLYKEFHSSTSEPFFRETRRRLWWCLYNLNLEVSIAYSRPQDLPQREIEAHYPLNIHDLDLNPNTSSVTAEANNSTLYSSLKFGASFYFAISSIYPRIISGPYPYAKELLLFDESTISAWETSLPSFFRTNVPRPPNYVFCHAILHWRCLNFRILMYRPFVVWLFIMRYRNNPPKEPRDPASVNTAITRCMKAAEESISTISDFWNSHTQNALTGWYALDFIFTAVLIPAMCLRYDPGSAQAPSWNLQVRKAVRVIESITLFNSSASHGLRIIKSLYKDPDSQETEHDTLVSNSAESHLQDSIPHPTTGVEDFFPSTPDILYVDPCPFDFRR
ncbi:lactose regulatory protein lac9 and GAL4-like protein [Penicillium brevicompactum]|uniref:Lactose regulatory protein lac9 and GAL4-like protein n=1 Tax=Penicillium brevicompactum TaxID=5074 RepID=A0A9W9QG48_PENBR|nr:lactose regulatory protein lac9 and GAL4-like protein [Penicillium brevicompactum]